MRWAVGPGSQRREQLLWSVESTPLARADVLDHAVEAERLAGFGRGPEAHDERLHRERSLPSGDQAALNTGKEAGSTPISSILRQ
jgi:hypothetical protein